MTHLEISSTFTVSSNALCFGSLHNIWEGTLVPVQGFQGAGPQRSGTVKLHAIEYNASAQSGTWNVYKLVNLQTKEATAWFAAHSDVDPQLEMAKILRVSGSPYESDSGSSVNDETTRNEGIFVINRYDWTYYDKRSWNEIGEGVEEGDADVLANSNSLGLVDFAAAKDTVRKWQQEKPSQREATSSGAWLYSPGAEYMFGRFGFDEKREHARSFLFFSTCTDFTNTSFSGQIQPLRVFESPQERFERRLREGYDFSGLKTIQDLTQQPDGPGVQALFPPPPPTDQQLGPYMRDEHILSEQDVEALNLYPFSQQHFAVSGLQEPASMSAPVSGFADTLKEQAVDLVNEMILGYLDRFFVPKIFQQSLPPAATLFPRHVQGNSQLDAHCYRHFTRSGAEPIPSFDAASVCVRIKRFLISRTQESVSLNDAEVSGICRVVAHLLTETLELAQNKAEEGGQDKIVPSDIRLAVLTDSELRHLLQFSTVFWNGRS